MRLLAFITIASILLGCGKEPAPGSEPVAASSAMVRFLISSAAGDFHKHGPKGPIRFRDVHVGCLKSSTGEKLYRLYGQFSAEQKDGKSEWTPFATLKTPGEGAYEQYVGSGAISYRKDPAAVWDDSIDHSSELEERLTSLRKKAP